MDTTQTNNSESTPKNHNSTNEQHHIVTILHDNRNKDLMTVREHFDSQQDDEGEEAKRTDPRLDLTINRAASSGRTEDIQNYEIGTLQTPGQPKDAVITKKTQPLISDRPSTKYSMELIFGSSNGDDVRDKHIQSGALDV